MEMKQELGFGRSEIGQKKKKSKDSHIALKPDKLLSFCVYRLGEGGGREREREAI